MEYPSSTRETDLEAIGRQLANVMAINHHEPRVKSYHSSTYSQSWLCPSIVDCRSWAWSIALVLDRSIIQRK